MGHGLAAGLSNADEYLKRFSGTLAIVIHRDKRGPRWRLHPIGFPR